MQTQSLSVAIEGQYREAQKNHTMNSYTLLAASLLLSIAAFSQQPQLIVPVGHTSYLNYFCSFSGRQAHPYRQFGSDYPPLGPRWASDRYP